MSVIWFTHSQLVPKIFNTTIDDFDVQRVHANRNKNIARSKLNGELIPELILLFQFFHISPLACDLSGLPVIKKDEDELTQADEQRK